MFVQYIFVFLLFLHLPIEFMHQSERQQIDSLKIQWLPSVRVEMDSKVPAGSVGKVLI